MNIKNIYCFIKAIPFYLKTGIWTPHIYEEVSSEKKIIISNANDFRVSDSFKHNFNETVHPNATLIKYKCIYCGKEDSSWFDGEIPVI